METNPLVSCIMPTCNRRPFVAQAIRYFLRQGYPDRELIVVDDGEDSVVDLIPDDPRIRYRHLDRRLSLGAKRNIACRMSRGELIAHWDDDDWMAPHRLETQVARLLRHNADVCGLHELLYYSIEAGRAWAYRYDTPERPWLAGGTLLYRRSVWGEHPFQEINIGEDAAWVRSVSDGRLLAIDDADFYVALIHSGNTATKNHTDRRWQQRPLDDVRRLLAPDLEFYAAIRNIGTSSNPARRPQPSSVTLAASFLVYDGYGSMSEYMAVGMARAGASVNIAPISIDMRGLSQEFAEIVERSRPEPGAPVLYFSWLHAGLERFATARDLFINTMWESSRLPSDWGAKLNRARAVIVPTSFVADVCRNCGVTVPVEVVPQGVDPTIYSYLNRPHREGLTTLIVGTVIPRKHVREGIAAWKRAFDGDPLARLVIKSRFQYGNYTPDDPRIQFVDTNETTKGITEWYQKADVLLALGNEGFGLPLVEAMATGLPVIALSSEGQGDICREVPRLLLPVAPERWEEYNEAPFGRCGVRGVPGIEAVAERLRWVAEHRDEARAMGRAASEWALSHRDIGQMGPAVLDVMERYVRPSRPLRRSSAFWVTSHGSACGIAEYTEHLAEHLPEMTIVSTPPDPQRLRLLHVQHHEGIFDERELTTYIRQARRARTKVVVTEHAVRPVPRTWEREADVLISLTKNGVDTLRQRWPDKRVEHIPHGCPTWFPPRKKKRGRTIGAFGFLDHHKGFWKLLDLLRALPGTDLLLFSHAKSSAIEDEWNEAVGTLPVHRISGFLGVEEIAHRLASEADILAFWYDEVDHASASGAVRVGLATGVPVLASPTSWFSELRDTTYQPEHLMDGAERLLEDTELRNRLTAEAHRYCNAHSWLRTAGHHQELWRSLE